MKYMIRKATIEDAKGKGYVHYTSWIETYTGLMDQDFLDTRSLDRCVVLAKRYPENTYVAEIEGKIVGFACYNKSRDEDLDEAGEIMAIYVLRDYFGFGIGRKLMESCYGELSGYKRIAIWVLKENTRAIEFYRYLGFKEDGKYKFVQVNENAKLHEIRMVLDRK